MSPAHKPLSANTQAILLLTAPLIAGREERSNDLLTAGEYKRLARHLREQQRQPADFLLPEAGELIDGCRLVVDAERLKRLLARGFLLSQAVERWRARAIWVVSRADADYPRRIKARLKDDAPAVIYGCGDVDLLDAGGLAVVGSRNVDDALVDYTEGIGRLTAKARRLLISGGARGIDQAAMRGALEAGGRVAGVLADSLEKTAMNREHRNLLMDGQLVLVSPYDPGAGFNVGNAMQRNKLIYALADAALVVSSDLNKGGTWAGAVEQLEKLRLVPIYVRSTGEKGKGLDALRNLGAMDWPNPDNADGFAAALNVAISSSTVPQTQDLLSLSLREPTAIAPVPPLPADEASEAPAEQSSTADDQFAAVREVLLRMLVMPKKEAEVAAELGVSTVRARKWLKCLVAEGALEKQKRPALYVVRQEELFGRLPIADGGHVETDA
jgi:predicted Rossmann fold nucleotide-binding protein DprA/Smf involved in DNA uptake